MKRRRPQLGGHASLVLLALILSACTVIGHEKVAGWPALEIVEHYVPHAEMRSRCGQYVGFGMTPEACAEFDFAARRCHLWFSADFPPQPWMVEHEHLHCQGYDHIGARTLAQLLHKSGTSTDLAPNSGTYPISRR